MMLYKYKKEIAREYGFTVKTLSRKLKQKEVVLTRGLLSPEQQEQIYNQLEYPPRVDPKDYEEGDK